MASAVGLLGDDLQRFGGVDAIAELGLIPMDLRGVEATHERQDLVAEDLAWHENGKAWRVRRHERRRDDRFAVLHLFLDVISRQVFAHGVVVGQEKCPTDVTLWGWRVTLAEECGVEPAEVGQWSDGICQMHHGTLE